MLCINNKSECCGCTACEQACPKKCITMKADMEGFLYPEVNAALCVECGVCERVCPVKNTSKPSKWVGKAYAARCKDLEVVQSSTSGGMFTPIAKLVLSKGGVICASKYDDNFHIIHDFLEDDKNQEFQKYRGSKYVQSNLGNCYRLVKEKLENKQLVCFVGTTCQVYGLTNFLGKDYDNLITIDLVCHGTPSPKLWKKYLDYQKGKFKSTIKNISFRHKTYGYHNSTMSIEFENGRIYRRSARVDYMLKSFFKEIASRPICYECPFKTSERVSDLSLFDCWHISDLVPCLKDDNRGYTNILVHSIKGETLLLDIKNNIDIYEINIEKAIKLDGSMVRNSAKPHPKRNEFYDDICSKEMNKCVKKYIPISWKDYVIEHTKGMLFKLGILTRLRKIKKSIKRKL